MSPDIYKIEIIEELKLFKKLYLSEREKNDSYVILLNQIQNENENLTEKMKQLIQFRRMFFEKKEENKRLLKILETLKDKF